MSYLPPREQARLGKNFLLKDYSLVYPERLKFKVKHYFFDLFIDVDNELVEGKATIEVDARGEVKLDAIHFEVKSVKVDGKDADYKYDGKTLSMELEGSHKLEVDYVARRPRTFKFVRKGEAVEACNVGEVMSAPHWIPVVDYPGMKATSEKVIKVKKPLVAVSNGRLVRRWEDGEYNFFHWVMDRPHSAYLNSVAVGNFAVYEEGGDPTLQYYLPRGYEKFLWNFSKTRDMIEFFSSYTGVRYPYEKYAQVVLFSMRGGMEYITSTHLTWYTLHDEVAEMDYSSDGLLSHELAHQWFGDLVTTKDWSNIWLNEGFATYFQALYFLHSRGEEEFAYEMYGKLKDYLEEYKKYSRPIVVRYYKWAEELFDRHTYPKGALVLHSLRSYLGDETFRKGIKNYLEKHKFSSVDTEDFKKAMEEVAGEDLTWFFDQYVYSAGHPVVNLYYDGKEVRLEQAGDVKYDLKLEVKVVKKDGTEKVIEVEEGAEEEGEYACLDPKFKWFKVVNDMQGEEMLIKETKDKELMCRIQAVNGLTRFSNPRSVSAIAELLNDPFWGVKYESAMALGKVGGEDALKYLTSTWVEPSKARRGVAKALGEFKYNERAGEYLVQLLRKERSYYVKADALVSLGKVGVAKFKEEVEAHFGEPSHNDVISSAVIEALSYFGDDESFNFVLEKGVKSEVENVRATSARVLWRFKDPRVREVLTAMLKDPSTAVRTSVVTSLGELKDKGLLSQVVNNEDEDQRVRATALRLLRSIEGSQ